MNAWTKGLRDERNPDPRRAAREPIAFRLDYPRRFDALPEVRAAILRHCDS
jgi:hypothetical protein